MSSVVNPFELGPTGLLAWGVVAHAIADFALQNEWLAIHKVERGGWSRRRRNAVRLSRDPTEVFAVRMEAVQQAARGPRRPGWWVRHPAAYVHAGIHLLALGFVFGLVSLPLAVAHLLIDTRTPVAWWSGLIGQTQPSPGAAIVDVGALVRFKLEQVFHLATIAVAAIAVTVLA